MIGGQTRPFSEGKANLYALADGFFYVAPTASDTRTCRQAGVLLLSLEGCDIEVKAAGGTHRAEGFLIAPGVHRQLDTRGQAVLSLHLDPVHPVYRAFAKNRTDCPIIPIDYSAYRDLDSSLHAAYAGEICADKAGNLFADLVSISAEFLPGAEARDDRIAQMLSELNSMAPEDIMFRDLVRQIGLSESRLSHLFSEDVGLPLRSFHLWKKIVYAIKMIARESNMTRVALDSGFSDSAHFSRTFRQTLGLSPSFLADNRCSPSATMRQIG
ncbi:MAG: helix-turn-helix domain-containing protein [Actinobacteria bacterium]|nr:helix-turn-helix domain-containing protein [Actinomycetota bacterium]